MDNDEELEQYTAEELVEASFVRTQVTADYAPDKTTEKQWELIRDECDSGGAMDERCEVVRASLHGGGLDVVAKRLACGCLMVAVDDLDRLDWDISGEK